MSTRSAHIQLPPHLQAFAEERVRAGEDASVDSVVLQAVEEKQRATLRGALLAGLVELDAGVGAEESVDAFMTRAIQRAGLDS